MTNQSPPDPEMMMSSLNDLLDELDQWSAPGSLEVMRQTLSDLDVAWEDIAPYVQFSERNYRRNLVKQTAAYQLLVLCWRNGQRSPIHDHRGSRCAVRVVKGTMTESLFTFAANGHIKPTQSRDFDAGQTGGSEDMDIHQISNLQANDADLITIHLYAPPLEVMGTYTLTDARRREEAIFLDFVDAAGI